MTDNGAGSYRRFLNGDESAVAEIMDELFLKLVFFVDGYVHDVHTSEDIAMDAVADLFIRRRYNFKSSLKTYLFMIGKSRAIDHLRRGKLISQVELREAAASADERADLEAAVLKDERNRSLYAALDGLPEDMRAAIHLVYFEQMSYDEAARVMKKTRKQVDNLLYRAKSRLRTIIGEDGNLL